MIAELGKSYAHEDNVKRVVNAIPAARTTTTKKRSQLIRYLYRRVLEQMLEPAPARGANLLDLLLRLQAYTGSCALFTVHDLQVQLCVKHVCMF